MKRILILLIIFIISNNYIFSKWTLIDTYNDLPLYKIGNGKSILFEGNTGYMSSGMGNVYKEFQIYKTSDRGNSWNISAKIDSAGWYIMNGKTYGNWFNETEYGSDITKNYLYLMFEDCERFKDFISYRLDDSTITRNAVVMKYNRKADTYKLIETNIYGAGHATSMKMLDDKVGFYLTHKELYKTKDSCKTWMKIYERNPVDSIAFWGLSAPTENDIYLTTNVRNMAPKRQFHYTHNGGQTWSKRIVYGIDKILFDSTGLGYILGNHSLQDSNNFEISNTFYVCKTTDDCETMDTILSRNGFPVPYPCSFHKNGNTILALHSKTFSSAISYNNGIDWQFLDTIHIAPYEYYEFSLSIGAIVDSNRLFFNNTFYHHWYIYDREPTGMKDRLIEETPLFIYPNPVFANKPLNIRFNTKDKNKITINIYDIQGIKRDSFTNDFMFNQNINLQYYNPEILVSGTYFIVIESSGEVIAREKFIVK